MREYVVIGMLLGITFTSPDIFGGFTFIVYVFWGTSSSTTVAVKGGEPTVISTITSTSKPWATTGILVVKFPTTGSGLIVSETEVVMSLQGAIPKTS